MANATRRLLLRRRRHPHRGGDDRCAKRDLRLRQGMIGRRRRRTQRSGRARRDRDDDEPIERVQHAAAARHRLRRSRDAFRGTSRPAPSTSSSIGDAAGYVGHHWFTPRRVIRRHRSRSSLPFRGAHVERLRLGTGIYLAALHEPADTCEQVIDPRSSVRWACDPRRGRRLPAVRVGRAPRAVRRPEVRRLRRDPRGLAYRMGERPLPDRRPRCLDVPSVPTFRSSSHTRRSSWAGRQGPRSAAPPDPATVGSRCRWRRCPPCRRWSSGYRAACAELGRTPYGCA